MASTDPAIEVVLALVGGRRPATEGVDWQRAAELLTTHGLGGLAVATHRSEPFLPATVAAGLEEAYLRTALHTTLTVEAGRRAHRALLEREIPALLFKGAALVDEGVYEDPGARAMGDADLLVRPDRLGVAVEALRSAGLEPWAPWNPGRADWVDAATFTDLEVAPGVDVTVDLHWRLGYSGLRYGGSDGEHDLWNGADLARGTPDAGAHLVVLLEHLLKHLHVAPHFPGMADIARVSARIRDWEPVRRRIEGRPTSDALFLLMDVLRRAVGAPVPPQVGHLAGGGLWRRGARRQLDLGRILASSAEADGGADGRVSGLLLRWAVLGSPRAVLGEVLHTVLPGRRWLRARYDAPAARPSRLLLRYWGDVARWLRGIGTSPVSPNQEFGE